MEILYYFCHLFPVCLRANTVLKQTSDTFFMQNKLFITSMISKLVLGVFYVALYIIQL